MTWQLVSLMLYTVLMMEQQADALERLCGRRLADALSLVCEGRGFYRISATKRLDKHFNEAPVPRTLDLLSLYNRKHTQNNSNNEEEHIRHRRSGPGVVNDCCYRTCSFAELERYCAPATGATGSADAFTGKGHVLFGSNNKGRTPTHPSSDQSSGQDHSAPQSRGLQNPSAFRQIFQGTWDKPFFFVTPARRDGLIDAAD